jgi:ubiquinone/menaquinone biosynthesis C-methylase UbiE
LALASETSRDKTLAMPHSHQRKHGNPAHLERYIARLVAPDRDEWQRPDEVVAALGLRPGHVIADLGAGPGYFTARLARRVGRRGRVFAVDVEPEILTVLRDRVAAGQPATITPVLGLPDDPLLPEASCDRVLSVNAYHHYPDGPAALRRMARLLRRGGRLALLDFHKREIPIGPPLRERVSREELLVHVERAGLRVAREFDFLPYQYFFLLRA